MRWSVRGWVWLCGQRRIRNTSLLRRLEAVARARGQLPLYFDVAAVKARTGTGERLFAKLIPALVGDCVEADIPSPLRAKRRVDVREEEGFREIVRRLRGTSAEE